MKKVKIGIAGNYLRGYTQDVFAGSERVYVNKDYVDSVLQAGGIPVILPPMCDDFDTLLEGLDGLILSGGYDVDPALYNEDIRDVCGYVDRRVDDYYIGIIHEADQLGIPTLGICKGIQAMNVAFGGTLHQDLKTDVKDSLKHVQDANRNHGTHNIHIKENSFLYTLFGESIRVNSYHHQAVKNVADGFEVIAKANDGVIEGIQKKEGTFMTAVQFHPEMMAALDDENMKRLFKEFIHICQK